MTALAPTPPAAGDLREALVLDLANKINPSPAVAIEAMEPWRRSNLLATASRALAWFERRAAGALLREAELIADAAAQRARAERLTTALKPFALFANSMDNLGHGAEVKHFIRRLTPEDFYAARAALSPQDTPASDGGTDARHT